VVCETASPTVQKFSNHVRTFKDDPGDINESVSAAQRRPEPCRPTSGPPGGVRADYQVNSSTPGRFSSRPHFGTSRSEDWLIRNEIGGRT
jgi:hypothetical protein